MEKPAIEGGSPVRKEFLPFARPSIGNEEVAAVTEVLKSGWLTTGPKTKQLEQEFARFIGSKYAVAVNSCTVGLHLALAALGIKSGDEVIVPSYTFAATANVVVHCGAKPVFAEIREEDFGLDPDDVRKRITKKTRAIIPVHFAGQPCDIGALKEIAEKHDLQVVEDCAHVSGATYAGKKAGRFGKVAAFSFYATKNITTGEGGMLVTEDEDLAKRFEVLRLHGMSREAWKRYGKEGNWQYEIIEAGYKYNLSDLHSALGLVQLKRVEELYRKRKAIAGYYAKALADSEALILPKELPGRSHDWHLYAVRLRLDRLRIDRARFIEALAKENIGASVHFIPLHLQPYYQRTFGYAKGMLPVTEKAFEGEVSLPLYPAMLEHDREEVVHAVKKITRFYAKD